MSRSQDNNTSEALWQVEMIFHEKWILIPSNGDLDSPIRDHKANSFFGLVVLLNKAVARQSNRQSNPTSGSSHL